VGNLGVKYDPRTSLFFLSEISSCLLEKDNFLLQLFLTHDAHDNNCFMFFQCPPPPVPERYDPGLPAWVFIAAICVYFAFVLTIGLDISTSTNKLYLLHDR